MSNIYYHARAAAQEFIGSFWGKLGRRPCSRSLDFFLLRGNICRTFFWYRRGSESGCLILFTHVKCDDSFTGNERMLVFILIRLKITFRRKVGFSLIDFYLTYIWIYEIAKPCKQFKKLPNIAIINPIIQYFHIKTHFHGSKISVSNKLILVLINIDEIFLMQSSEFTKSLYFGSNWEELQK